MLLALKGQELPLVRLDQEHSGAQRYGSCFLSLEEDDAIDDNKHLDESLHLVLDDVHATWQVSGKNFISPKCSSIAPQPDKGF